MLPSGAYLVANQVSGWIICAAGVGVSEPLALSSLITPLPNVAGSCIVSGPPLLPGVAISS